MKSYICDARNLKRNGIFVEITGKIVSLAIIDKNLHFTLVHRNVILVREFMPIVTCKRGENLSIFVIATNFCRVKNIHPIF